MPTAGTPNNTAAEPPLSSPPASPKRAHTPTESEPAACTPARSEKHSRPQDEPPADATATPHDKKLHALHTSNSTLRAQITALQTELHALRGGLINPAAEQTVQRHIKLLHDYNELRDVGLGLVGLLAENRGVRVKDVLEEMGVEDD